MRFTNVLLLLTLIAPATYAKEFHVSVQGNDGNDGSSSNPFATISAAAKAAQPGDSITVHEGTYRERVTPPRGGTSDDMRIVYQAAPGEKVVIKGSEVVRDWKPFKPGVWKATLPNSFFGQFNPYKDLIAGGWFEDNGRPHHTGEVYLNGKSLFETDALERVLSPGPLPRSRDRAGSTWTWFCEVDDENTYLYANFHDKNPNEELVEINVRRACFYPDNPGCNYITVRGFRMCHAATQWAPPDAEQIGLIGAHWSKGWIIENNVISDSKCSGITLGMTRRQQIPIQKDLNKDEEIVFYYDTIVGVLEAGWSQEKIGSHIVRYNTIFDCEQTGICGAMGAAFSQITGNHIYNIYTKRQFGGFEMAGIKLHAAIDVLISNNRVHGCSLGLWMDWMAQGTRISRNLCYDNDEFDLFMEINHGPFVVDNNLFLSRPGLLDMSGGGAYVHNLMNGTIIPVSMPFRTAPYHLPHSTAVTGLSSVKEGDNCFYNNIFATQQALFPSFGLAAYNDKEISLQSGGNVYYNGARPYANEKNPIEQSGWDPKIQVAEKPDGVYLHLTLGEAVEKAATTFVTTELLGKPKVTGVPYENADGSRLIIDTDYLGRKRSTARPSAGPFETPGAGRLTLKVW